MYVVDYREIRTKVQRFPTARFPRAFGFSSGWFARGLKQGSRQAVRGTEG